MWCWLSRLERLGLHTERRPRRPPPRSCRDCNHRLERAMVVTGWLDGLQPPEQLRLEPHELGTILSAKGPQHTAKPCGEMLDRCSGAGHSRTRHGHRVTCPLLQLSNNRQPHV